LVDGKKAEFIKVGDKQTIVVGAPIVKHSSKQPVDHALNIEHKGYPVPFASINTNPDTSLYQAIDGRIWYFPEITNRWTTLGSTSKHDWFSIDFGQPKKFQA
jgi:hypothetical protein